MQWETADGLVPYDDAVARMEQHVASMAAGKACGLVWLLEHPPLYTAGTSAKADDLLHAQFPVFQTGRGGQYTYHGPGQRVAYVMMDLRRESGFGIQDSEKGDSSHEQGQITRPAGRGSPEPSPIANDSSHEQGQLYTAPDLRRYVQRLEQWIILTLAEFGVKGELREGRVGVWVVDQASGRPSPEPSPIANDSRHERGQLKKENKIAALGVRVRRGVAYHGVALNVNPDLSHYAGIVPCGIREHGVTSLHALGVMATMNEVDAALKECFAKVFSFTP